MHVLYRHAFGVYLPLYSLYKRAGDRRKLKLLRGYVRPGMRVLDIGANVGFYTRVLSNLVGSEGSAHAFEPDPDNFARLKSTTRRCGNVMLTQAAVTAMSGNVRLFRSGSLNVDHRCYDSGDGREIVDVPSVAVDGYFLSNEAVDCIKIDIQGFEVSAFRGMRATLARSPRTLLVGEMWPFGLRMAGSSVDEYVGILRDMGFVSESFESGIVHSLLSHAHDEAFYTDIIASKGDLVA